MADPVEYLTGIATKTFFTDVSTRIQEYHDFYDFHLSQFVVKDRMDASNIDYEAYRGYVKSNNYWEICFQERELGFNRSFKKEIEKRIDTNKHQIYAELKVREMDQIIKKVAALELEPQLQKHRDSILEKIKKLRLNISDTYLQVPITTIPTPKIQWLGKTNVLATLIYDLWQGQDNGRGNPQKPHLIKAQKKDLEQLLLNNFLDKEGKPLKPSVISDYLNTSKSDKRVKKGLRIELPPTQ